MAESSGGILGGYPLATGNVPSSSRPAGILYTYNDPERGQDDRSPGQFFDPPRLDPFGVNASPTVSAPLNNFLTSMPASTLTPPFLNVAQPGPSTGQPEVPQLSRATQSGTEADYSKGPSLGVPKSQQAAIPFAPQLLQPAAAATRPPEFPNDQTYRDFGIDARIHYPAAAQAPGIGTDDGWITPPAPPRDGGRRDWAAYLDPGPVVLPSAKIGDPRIDRTTEFLLDALVEAVKELGSSVPEGSRPTIFGTLAHSLFAKKVAELDLPGIGQDGIEQSWESGTLIERIISGSKRTDIYLKNEFGRPIAIYDLKTGNAQLTPARIQELRDAVGAGDIPVIELRWADLTALQR